MKNVAHFFEELKRRNVYKAATAYAITSWLLIQIANTIAPNLNLPDTVPATITKILIIGFPIVLLLAWLFELTSDGFKLTKDSDRTLEDGKKIGKRLNKGIIISLALLVSLLLVDRFFFRGKTLFKDNNTASIAVLPFANFSPEKENEYMADGLTEQILNELSNISGMKVPARTSSFAFKNQGIDIRHIAEELEVNYVLEGSVRFHQDKIRITAQLINAANGFHLWSNTYDESFDEVFEIQESISRKVANELKVRLLPQEEEAIARRLTENSEAYKLYLKSREYSQLRDDPSLKKAIELLEDVIELEPNFAEAHAELSFLYNQLHFYGSLDRKTRDVKSKLHIEKALELAPDKPEVIRANAIYMQRVSGTVVGDTAKIIRDLRKALQLKPNYADGHYLLASQFFLAKQFELSLKHKKRTVELDPLNSFYAAQYAHNLYSSGKDPEQALNIIDRLLKIDSIDGHALAVKAEIVLGEYGDLEMAFKLRHKNLKADPTNRFKLSRNTMIALDLDLWPLAEKYVKTLQLRYSGTRAIYSHVMYYYYYQKDYEAYQQLLQYLMEQYYMNPDDLTKGKSTLEFVKGNTEKALAVFEEGFPKIANGTVFNASFQAPIDTYIAEYINYLYANGKQEKAKAYAARLCSYYNAKIANEPISKPYKDQLLLNCYYASDQKDNFLNYLEEIYFVKKNRYDIFRNMKAGMYDRYEDDEDYQELYRKIEGETHRIRVEVINYLKEKGDWNEEWDGALGLN